MFVAQSITTHLIHPLPLKPPPLDALPNPSRIHMLHEHTLDQLRILRLDGVLQALTDQATSTASAAMSFPDRLALLVQREIDWRDNKRLERLLKAAKLKATGACIEDTDHAINLGRLARPCAKRPHHRRHGRRQNVVSLRARATSGTFRLYRALCTST
jgi:hypothetical protein